MLRAIAGDIIGSIYERRPRKTTDFPLFGSGCCFTDDGVLTVAVADGLLKLHFGFSVFACSAYFAVKGLCSRVQN
jgi:ADP-ribosylglycohydrolase